MTESVPVLVVGSYPPIPLPSSDASIEAVRRAWGDGHDVVTASPRLSAATHHTRIYGPLAGSRLRRLNRRVKAQRITMVVEQGCPITAAPAKTQRVAVEGLVRALAGFSHVSIVKVGDLHLPPALERRLLAAAHEVITVPGEPTSVGVTPVGPTEVRPTEMPRHLATLFSRRIIAAAPRGAKDAVKSALRGVKGALRRP